MEIIPAIDLMNGKVVRLMRGEPATQKTYERLEDPVTVAQKWISEGARYLHIIDLDAALGLGENTAVIKRLIKTVGVPTQVGGGIGSLEIAKDYLEIGADRIVLGSFAFKDPSQVQIIIEDYSPERVTVALDNLHGKVMVRGWKASTGITVEQAISMFSSLGVKFFLLTSVARDGTLVGPDLETLDRICHFKGIHIIAAGGIGSLEDLANLKKMGVYGVVIGKALYEGKIRLGDALKMLEDDEGKILAKKTSKGC